MRQGKTGNRRGSDQRLDAMIYSIPSIRTQNLHT